jgi:hypothetical protein
MWCRNLGDYERESIPLVRIDTAREKVEEVIKLLATQEIKS